MTRKMLSIALCLFLLSVFFSNPCFAFSTKGPVQKLGRGIIHIAFALFQVPKSVIEVAGETEPSWIAPIAGATQGVGQGFYQMFRQLISGIADVLTFPSPAGRDWAPLVESESLFPNV